MHYNKHSCPPVIIIITAGAVLELEIFSREPSKMIKSLCIRGIKLNVRAEVHFQSQWQFGKCPKFRNRIMTRAKLLYSAVTEPRNFVKTIKPYTTRERKKKSKRTATGGKKSSKPLAKSETAARAKIGTPLTSGEERRKVKLPRRTEVSVRPRPSECRERSCCA